MGEYCEFGNMVLKFRLDVVMKEGRPETVRREPEWELQQKAKKGRARETHRNRPRRGVEGVVE